MIQLFKLENLEARAYPLPRLPLFYLYTDKSRGFSRLDDRFIACLRSIG